jgi:DNA-binding IscR family transcriptional regulator
MSSEEIAVMTAVYDLGTAQRQFVPYGDIADRLDTSITVVKTVVALLRNRGLVTPTFGGVQLNSNALELVSRG